MFDTSQPLPSSRELAQRVMTRIEEIRCRGRKVSLREVEAGAGTGRGTLHRIEKIAQGTIEGSFHYESIKAIDDWLTLAPDQKKSTGECADA